MDLYYLGPQGTYSEIAACKAKEFLKEKYTLKPISTIAKVIDLVQKSKNDIAVLPIENSIEGIVRSTIDNLYNTDCKIQAQINIKIEHCLVSKGKLENVKHIISHPQALSQASKFILENFDENIDLIEANSTAQAITMLSNKDSSYCAIGSEKLANELELNILAKNIGDIKDNTTRFVLIAKEKMFFENNTRTSIVFNTKNESGALLKVLEIIKKYNLNLVYLESRPSKEIFGEYNFFSDIDVGCENIKEALAEIKQECNYYKLLGSYPQIN